MDEIEAAGFLFDMDGTLVDSTAVVESVWTAFGRRHGLDPAALLAYAHGRQAVDTVAHFLPELSVESRDGLVRGLVAEEITRTDGIVEVPGAAALLDRLLSDDVPVAVVTSAPRELAIGRMRAAGVPLPPVLIAAEDVARGKPDPQGYVLAAERIRVPISECVVFEDADAGLQAAVASGARVVVVGRHESPVTVGLERLIDYSGLRAAAG
ncbi:HAD-IA family hydrolase [Leifsonia shinshuensis]|uniref:HAD-IA family hydrolase n=1 Tax=Leifsonia shinshuensis TaxID=150026 RepID=UPI002864C461|nr:HAD-IA family hydrolase [Leifsonia shinshuensis]MDR6972563.1 sugar-phosphatase [Leifsonia shinshuensis]